MRGLWAFLNDKANRAFLGWLGGGLATLAVGAWAVFTYVFPPDKGGETQPALSVESQGGVAAGRDIHARDITIGAKPIHREARLSLVDIVVSATDEFPRIEVKVRNNSDEVIFLKGAEITTLKQWDIPSPGAEPLPVAVSWTYDVTIPLQGTSKYNISQEIRPNSVDRFEFRVGSDHHPYPYIGLFAYLLRLKLIYNEDNREVITPSVLLHIPSSWQLEAVHIREPQIDELEKNKKAAQDILRSIEDSTVIQEGVLKKVNLWAEADFSEFTKRTSKQR